MEFGIHLPNSGPLTAAADLVGMARRAEELGFATAWVFDHLFNPAATPRGRDSYHNRPDMPYYDALTLLSHAHAPRFHEFPRGGIRRNQDGKSGTSRTSRTSREKIIASGNPNREARHITNAAFVTRARALAISPHFGC